MYPAAPAWQATLTRAWRQHRDSLTTPAPTRQPPAAGAPPMSNDVRAAHYRAAGRVSFTPAQRRRLAKHAHRADDHR